MTQDRGALHDIRHNDSEHTATSDSLVAKYNSTVLIAGMHGIDSKTIGDNGLVVDDVRLVSAFSLSSDGMPGEVLLAEISEDGTRIAIDYLFDNGVQLFRRILLDDGCVHEQLDIRSAAPGPVRFPLILRYDADFVSIFEMRGERRARRGRIHETEICTGYAIRSYTGLDERLYQAEFAFSGHPDLGDNGVARYEIALGTGTGTSLYFRYGRPAGKEAIPGDGSFAQALEKVTRGANRFAAASARMESGDPLIGRWLGRSLSDLGMLMMTTGHGDYPAAGLPWYATQFGRDGIVTALQTLTINPALAKGVLGFLAANQATETDPGIAAEPGKIGHEFRRDEMSRIGEKPFARYYGGADTTLLFVMLAGEYLKRTGDIAFLRDILSNVEAALDWMEGNRMVRDDGFVSFSYGQGGVMTQFWKDSDGSVVHRDDEWGARDLPESFFDSVDLRDIGELVVALNRQLVEAHGFPTQAVLREHFFARGMRNEDHWKVLPPSRKKEILRAVYRSKLMPRDPVAPAALQGYAYAAMMAAADIGDTLGLEIAEGWRQKARAFRTRFEECFWLDADGFYALALDGDGRPCRVMASDAGHLLYSGIVPEEKAARVVASLMHPSSFSGYGIRTMAEGQKVAGFGYLTYHNGSVWPHDTAICAAGMARYGFYEPAAKVMQAVADASAFLDGRLFEVYSGAPRVDGEAPEKYHAACAPQAWAAGSAFMLVEAALGLELAAEGGLVARAPRMPVGLPEMTVRWPDGREDVVLTRTNGADPPGGKTPISFQAELP
ncbi:MAG: hypothetical protein EOM26_12500 [Alphaproteobacteria bacterium]|nr:hypothetical protein [Alphaproteobacteria bacterium]